MFVVVWVYTAARPARADRAGLMIEGIIYSVEDSSAFIGGHIVKEGDVINGARVVKINQKTVEFEKDKKRWKQRVREKPNPAW